MSLALQVSLAFRHTFFLKKLIALEGFGKRSSWLDDDELPTGHQMTFKDSLHIASTDIFLKLFIPNWILRHGTAKMQSIEVAFDELSVSVFCVLYRCVL